MLRQCSKCHEPKPLELFRMTLKCGKPYRRTLCRDCEIVYGRSARHRSLARDAENRRRDCGLLKQKDAAKSLLYRERHPEKTRAKEILRSAITSGTIIRPSACEKCEQSLAPKRNGASRIQGHHPDYNEPLLVKWLCEPCHMKEHRRAP